MAEAVGLALGTVALASLFSSCIELLDYFELGRSHEYDYDVACLKLSLLRARLDSWGDVLSVRDAGREAEALRIHWSQEQDVIARSLLGIQNIFGNVEALKDKYELVPRKSSTLPGFLPSRTKSIPFVEDGSSSHKSSASRRFSLFRRSTRWAIRDKQKFDALLTDLEFFISNLEHVLARINMSRPEKHKYRDRHRDVSTSESSGSDTDSSRDHGSSRRSKKPAKLGAVFGDKGGHSEEIRRKIDPTSNNGGHSTTIKGHKFVIKNTEDQAAFAQGEQGSVSAPKVEPSQRSSFKIKNMRGQSTALQGINSDRSINDLFANQRALVQQMQASASGDQGSAQKQASGNFNGPGRTIR